MMDYSTYTRTCEQCGAVMEHVASNTKYCPACALRRQEANSKPKSTAYQRQQAKADASAGAINEVNRRAAAKGLSYGMYVARQRLAKEAGA